MYFYFKGCRKFSKTRALTRRKNKDYCHDNALNLANQFKLINVFPTTSGVQSQEKYGSDGNPLISKITKKTSLTDRMRAAKIRGYQNAATPRNGATDLSH
ncbi:hypothetical protein [Desulforhopalus sp. IMCC35007]|uniref:hypothetical protein n=1 Tax=Desulforhopalus sp. IMCC35007 TaxID=2569543 RepID=UPI0010ADB837|nr:hypothetical protein [Desulforhopalus sp. IMCC35007]TKB06600.1 hypothetical protein FCL48_20225 [Desulforhopalus sp. IMCC35007]